MPGFPIDPVVSPLTPEAFRNSIRSLIQSYHASDTDFLAEVIQNAVDALEEHFSTAERKEFPRLEIHVDTAQERLTIFDNGPGLPDRVIMKLGSPNFTTKFGKRRRGHKGVGLSFAAWSSDAFRFATKRPGEKHIVSGKIEGGATWILNGGEKYPKLEEDPAFKPTLLEGVPSGTVFEFQRSGNFRISTLVRRLKTAGIEHLLRTATALGYADLPVTLDGALPPWLARLKVTFGIDGSEPTSVSPGYLFPHHHWGKHAFALDALRDMSEDRRERLRGTKKCLYTFLDNDKVVEMFKSPDDANLADLCRREKVRAYGAFLDSAATFTAWNESLYRQGGVGGRRRQLARAGIHFVTATMPAGEVLDVYLRFGTGNANRLFCLVQFDDVPPDLGRKTFDRDIVDIAQRIANKFSGELFVPNRKILLPSEEPHGESEAVQEMTLQDLIKKAEAKPQLDVQTLGLTRTPWNEQEVVALFHALVGIGFLRGYRIHSVFGSTEKYDSIFRYKISKSQSSSASVPSLGLDQASFGSHAEIELWPRILEFKHKLSSLVEEFESGSKAFHELHVAVVWEEGDAGAFGGSSNYRLAKIDGPLLRTFYGATHVLTSLGSPKKIEVLVLRDLVQLFSESQAGKLALSS